MYIVLASSRLYSYWRQAITGDDDDDMNPLLKDSVSSSVKQIGPCFTGVRLCDGPDLKLVILVGWDRSSFVCCLVRRGSNDDLLLFRISTDFQLCCLADQGSPSVSQHVVSVKSSSLILHSIRLRFVFNRDDSLTS